MLQTRSGFVFLTIRRARRNPARELGLSTVIGSMSDSQSARRGAWAFEVTTSTLAPGKLFLMALRGGSIETKSPRRVSSTATTVRMPAGRNVDFRERRALQRSHETRSLSIG